MTDQGPTEIETEREVPPEPLPGHISPRRQKLQRRQRTADDDEERARDRVHTPHDDDPPEDADPEHREGMTIGDIEPEDGEKFPDTAGRAPPKNLVDICTIYPIGNGAHYIRVERLKPTALFNMPCAGVLQEIQEPMSERQFRDRYGGGTYELIVYGPDPRGRTNPQTEEPIIKALTKPIRLVVPGKPNPATLQTGRDFSRTDDVETSFDRRFGRGGLPPTSAEASMHRDGVTFAQNLVTQERQKTERLEEERRKQIEQHSSVITTALENAHREVRTRLEAENTGLRDRLSALERKFETQVKPPSETQAALSVVKELTSTFNPPGRSNEAELTRIHDSHRQEILRVTDQHKGALDDLRRTTDDRIKVLQDQLEQERRRNQEHEREMRDQHDRKDKDLREDQDKRLRDVIDRHDRELRDVEGRHQSEIARVRSDLDREIKAIERQGELLRTTDKSALEARLGSMKDRLELLKDELDRARAEAAEKPSLTEQLQDAETQAKLLGYEKKDESGPRDWKERLAESVGTAIMNADKIVQSYGEASARKVEAQATADAQKLRAQGQQAQQQPGDRRLPNRPPGPPPPGQVPQRRVIGGAGGPIPARQTMWSTEEGGSPVDPRSVPADAPSVQSGAMRGSPDAPPAPAPAAPAAPPEAQAAPPPPPTPPAPQQAAEEPQEEATLEQQRQAAQELENLKIWVELEISRGSDPADFAQRLVERVGPARTFHMSSQVPVDEILKALAGDPKSFNSPILKREGQAFFRKAWTEARRYSQALLQQQQAEAPAEPQPPDDPPPVES